MALFTQTQKHNPTALKIPTSASLTFPSLSAASSPDICTTRGSDLDVADSWEHMVRLGHYQVGFICCLWQAVKSGPAGPHGELRQGTSARLPWGSTAAAPVPRADVMPRSGSPCSHWLIASRQRWVIALVLVYQACRVNRVHLSEKG